MPWEPEHGRNSQDNNLPFLHRSDKSKDIPKFLQAAGTGILCSKRCLLKQRKQTPSRRPVPDHLKYVATLNKITLRTKNSPFQLSDQERNWESKEEILILFSHASLILVDIFT
jgi:hypothetical protein